MNDEVELIMDADRFIVGVGLRKHGDRVTVDAELAEQLVRSKWAHVVPVKNVKHSEE